MHIAILGATSQIAQDLILSFAKNTDYSLSLFGRNISYLDNFIKTNNLETKYKALQYNEFNNQHYDVIINFVGVGDPAKAQKLGSDIFAITEQYDNLAINYIKKNKKTQYIFLSSGAVYGGDYKELVKGDTISKIDINNLNQTHWYAIAKLYAEAKHRALPNLSIIDVRVFNYFSATMDINARFFITDMVRAIKNKEIFKTSKENIVRDFITPVDFYNLIIAIINFQPINIALDCYTTEPVAKFDLLQAMKKKFGLNYEINTENIINATGVKINYFSTYKKAEEIGYIPRCSSIDGVIHEMHKTFKQ